MKGLFIINYCSDGCDPMKSITQLNESEAYKLAKKLSEENKGTSFNRFGDYFKYYYPKRIRTEKWLYDWFIKLGGKPMTKHPIYFVLNGSEYLNEWFGKGKVTRLQLEEIESCDISFTFGDSMSMMDKEGRRDPVTKEVLYDMIRRHNGDVERFLNAVCKDFNYIEVQLWNYRYLKH